MADGPVDNVTEYDGEASSDDGWSSLFQGLLKDSGKAYIAHQVSGNAARSGAPTAVAAPQDVAAAAQKAKQKQMYTAVGVVAVIGVILGLAFMLKRR